MGVWIAFFLLLCTFWIRQRSLYEGSLYEGFDPNHPDERPPGYPDQTYSAHLIEAEKQIYRMLETPSSKSPYLQDLLMLLQMI